LPSPLAGEGRVRGLPNNFFTPSPVAGERAGARGERAPKEKSRYALTLARAS
jgi:hypothetical protein